MLIYSTQSMAFCLPMRVLVEQTADMCARGAAVLADSNDSSDLGQRQPAGLGGTDETESGQGVAAVVTVTGGIASGLGQQPGLLIEPEGLG